MENTVLQEVYNKLNNFGYSYHFLTSPNFKERTVAQVDGVVKKCWEQDTVLMVRFSFSFRMADKSLFLKPHILGPAKMN